MQKYFLEFKFTFSILESHVLHLERFDFEYSTENKSKLDSFESFLFSSEFSFELPDPRPSLSFIFC